MKEFRGIGLIVSFLVAVSCICLQCQQSAVGLQEAGVKPAGNPGVKTDNCGGCTTQQTPTTPHIVAPPDEEENAALFGAHLQRTMTLLKTSNKDLHLPVFILMYGQSIVGSSAFTELLNSYLHQQFPYADIRLENRAIGGFTGDRLVRTAIHDLYPAYPDLVIFHVYGGQDTGQTERIISNLRRYTTADILLFNDHRVRDIEIQESSINWWRRIAQKYNCELVDVSAAWPKYLSEHDLQPAQMLRDGTHPSVDGYTVLTDLIARHLQFNNLVPNNWEDTVRDYEARRFIDEGVRDEVRLSGDGWTITDDGVVGTAAGSVLHLDFDGNRVDAIAAHVKPGQAVGTARILLDGKLPSDNPDVYTITRPSGLSGSWFPAVMRVSHTNPLIVENWTLRITKINSDASEFSFDVIGSKTGPDGSGSSGETFISNSGRVKIEPRDWMLATIMKTFKMKDPPPVGFEIKWSVKPMFEDAYTPEAPTDKTRVYETTLFQLISNTHHTVDLIPNGDGIVPIQSLRVYRPPLR